MSDPTSRPDDPSGSHEPLPRDAARVLDLREADRPDLPGLYALNTEQVPRTRLLGIQALLAVAALHNLVRYPDGQWGLFLAVALTLEVYAAASLVVLRAWFARVRRVHLGTVFLVADLACYTLVIYATGAESSWLWPIYLLRVADQMWISRRRAAGMALAGVSFYLALLLWLAFVERQPVSWELVAVRLLVLGSMGAYMVLAAGLPWNLQARTLAAGQMIRQLDAQSKALEEERRRAERASVAKTEFLARMSHELRTPLNSVVGFSNVLLRKRGAPWQEKEQEYLTRIRDNGVHLLALINDVLDIARIDEGTMEITLGHVNLGDLIRGTVKQLEEGMEGSPVRIALTIPPDLRTLRADDARLRQIVINLVGNAIKFTAQGWIHVEVEADEDTHTPVRLVVADSGIGIAQDRIATIFDTFEQAEGGTNRRYGGTGLGLAICRSLCRLQGFDLTVESAVGRGSTFAVHFFPERQAAGAAPVEQPTPDPRPA